MEKLVHTTPNLPPVLGVEELSQLIKKSPASIIADRSRAPYRLPPSCEPPESRQPLWILSDVLDWLRHYQRPGVPAPVASAPAQPADTPRRRGRPTKAEQARRVRLNAEQKKGGAQ